MKMLYKQYIFSSVMFIGLLCYLFYASLLDIEILEHTLISAGRMILGYFLAVFFGVLLAVVISSNKILLYTFNPIISFLMSIPTITWVPILLVSVGVGNITIILTIFLGSFFAILYNTMKGLESVDTSTIKAAKIMGYSKFRILIEVSIPSSFSAILVGLKLGVAYSWRALVGAEMLGATESGLGYLIFTSRAFYDYEKMIIAIFLIGFLGYLMNRIVMLYIEKRTLVKWGVMND